MRCCLLLCVLCVATHLVVSMPVEPSGSALQPEDQKETLETLNLGDPRHDISARDKRTIGFLRQLFPGLSQILDNVVQNVTRVLFRVIGRLVLQGGLLGGGGGGGDGGGTSSSSGGNSSRRISIVLPTYPPGADDEEEDNTEMAASEANPEAENQLAGAESQQNEVRVQYTDPEQQADLGHSDQEEAASGGNGNPADAVDGETEEDPRNKRFLTFGLGGGDASSSSSSGSGGGSGNFIFDIIRLITGSGNTDSSDDSKPAEVSAGGEGNVEKDDGYQAGIPGPITRLFVIANRGIANLVQDLILRLAQTSERIVNFKARLITSII